MTLEATSAILMGIVLVGAIAALWLLENLRQRVAEFFEKREEKVFFLARGDGSSPFEGKSLLMDETKRKRAKSK